MKKRYFLSAVGMILVLGGFGAFYRLYFKKQFEAYAQNKQLLEDVAQRLTELEEKFNGIRPGYVLQEWKGAVQPWADAVNQRAQFFGMDKAQWEPVPENEMPRFHYEEVFPKMVHALKLEAYRRQCAIPEMNFGAPAVVSLANRSVTKEEVNTWLRSYAEGAALLRTIMEWKPYQINHLEVWPPRREYELLDMHTVGVDMTITLDNLVRMLESTSRDMRYFSVDAIRIHNSHLRGLYNPPLKVALLFTRAEVYEEKAAGGEGSGEVDVDKIMAELREAREKRAAKAREKKERASDGDARYDEYGEKIPAEGSRAYREYIKEKKARDRANNPIRRVLRRILPGMGI